MVSIRHFEETDLEVIQVYCMPDKRKDDILSRIHEWNTLLYQGKYFEMFAIQNNTTIVGSISIYERSKSIVSLGIEIFPKYRQRGYAADAMRLLMEHTKQKGYGIIQQQIRVDNLASINLHEKLGFETDGYVYVNRKGHKVLIYLMSL